MNFSEQRSVRPHVPFPLPMALDISTTLLIVVIRGGSVLFRGLPIVGDLSLSVGAADVSFVDGSDGDLRRRVGDVRSLWMRH